MTPTKILIGQIALVFAIALAGIWLATEWTANKLAFQPELGEPWARIGTWPIYRPWAIFPWWYHYAKIRLVAARLSQARRFGPAAGAV
jgi:type IV secretion system protein VirD4